MPCLGGTVGLYLVWWVTLASLVAGEFTFVFHLSLSLPTRRPIQPKTVYDVKVHTTYMIRNSRAG